MYSDIITNWVWNPKGWLAVMGVMDYAGYDQTSRIVKAFADFWLFNVEVHLFIFQVV